MVAGSSCLESISSDELQPVRRDTDSLREQNEGTVSASVSQADLPYLYQRELSSCRIEIFFKPYGGEHGGDRFSLALASAGKLFFYIADATGHGPKAYEFWQYHRPQFDAYWRNFCDGCGGENDVKKFAAEVNELLWQRHAQEDQLCMLTGVWLANQELYFANFGFGTHILVQTQAGLWWTNPEKSFGLKLGWALCKNWEKLARAFVPHAVPQVQRLILLTDAFLGDDYAAPLETLKNLRQLAETVVRLPGEEIIPHFLKHCPHQDDDATLVVLERDVRRVNKKGDRLHVLSPLAH